MSRYNTQRENDQENIPLLARALLSRRIQRVPEIFVPQAPYLSDATIPDTILNLARLNASNRDAPEESVKELVEEKILQRQIDQNVKKFMDNRKYANIPAEFRERDEKEIEREALLNGIRQLLGLIPTTQPIFNTYKSYYTQPTPVAGPTFNTYKTYNLPSPSPAFSGAPPGLVTTPADRVSATNSTGSTGGPLAVNPDAAIFPAEAELVIRERDNGNIPATEEGAQMATDALLANRDRQGFADPNTQALATVASNVPQIGAEQRRIRMEIEDLRRLRAQRYQEYRARMPQTQQTMETAQQLQQDEARIQQAQAEAAQATQIADAIQQEALAQGDIARALQAQREKERTLAIGNSIIDGIVQDGENMIRAELDLQRQKDLITDTENANALIESAEALAEKQRIEAELQKQQVAQTTVVPREDKGKEPEEEVRAPIPQQPAEVLVKTDRPEDIAKDLTELGQSLNERSSKKIIENLREKVDKAFINFSNEIVKSVDPNKQSELDKKNKAVAEAKGEATQALKEYLKASKSYNADLKLFTDKLNQLGDSVNAYGMVLPSAAYHYREYLSPTTSNIPYPSGPEFLIALRTKLENEKNTKTVAYNQQVQEYFSKMNESYTPAQRAMRKESDDLKANLKESEKIANPTEEQRQFVAALKSRINVLAGELNKSLTPQQKSTHQQLGKMARELGKKKRAVDVYDKVIELVSRAKVLPPRQPPVGQGLHGGIYRESWPTPSRRQQLLDMLREKSAEYDRLIRKAHSRQEKEMLQEEQYNFVNQMQAEIARESYFSTPNPSAIYEQYGGYNEMADVIHDRINGQRGGNFYSDRVMNNGIAWGRTWNVSTVPRNAFYGNYPGQDPDNNRLIVNQRGYSYDGRPDMYAIYS